LSGVELLHGVAFIAPVVVSAANASFDLGACV
jgi:hypothetical protein